MYLVAVPWFALRDCNFLTFPPWFEVDGDERDGFSITVPNSAKFSRSTEFNGTITLLRVSTVGRVSVGIAGIVVGISRSSVFLVVQESRRSNDVFFPERVLDSSPPIILCWGIGSSRAHY